MKKLATLVLVAFSLACSSPKDEPLRVGIAPYQDIAMIVNLEPLGLEEEHGVEVKLQTMAWEEILPAVASGGRTIDVGFGSLVEFLTKERALNRGVSDPVVFVYPAYIYKGGGFATMGENAPDLTDGTIEPSEAREFLSLRIGAQKNSVYEMMLFSLAKRNGIPIDSLNVADISLNDGLLALQNGDLDLASAGLTQRAEIEKQGGRIVLTMESLGFADVTGFISKRSILETRRSEVEALLRMWFASVDFVLSDLQGNSEASLEYLRRNAATQYSFEEYSTALAQEYFPRTIAEVNETILSPGGTFSFSRISGEIVSYLEENQVISESPEMPEPIELR